MNQPVEVISKSNCIQCTMTKRKLQADGVEFIERMIETDSDALAKVRQLGYTSMPVVVAGDNHWSGFQPDRIKSLLN